MPNSSNLASFLLFFQAKQPKLQRILDYEVLKNQRKEIPSFDQMNWFQVAKYFPFWDFFGIEMFIHQQEQTRQVIFAFESPEK